MSIKLMTRVWELDVGHPEQAVLLALADWADDDGVHLFPSQRRVAWKTGYSERQVRRILKELEAQGALVVLVRGNQYRSTQYKLDLAVLPEKTPFEDLETAPDNMAAAPEEEHRTSTTVNRTSTTEHRTSSASEPDTDVRLSVREPSTEPSAEPSPASGTRRDLIWEAFVIFTGITPAGPGKFARGVPLDERAKWNEGIKSLRAAGVTEEEAPRLIEAFAKRWPGASLTPSSLARRVGELRRDLDHGIPTMKPEPGARSAAIAAEIRRREAEHGEDAPGTGARAALPA